MATEVEFESKARADKARDDHSQYLCLDDDKRLKTVTFASDTPAGIIDQPEAAATSEKAAAEEPALEAIGLTDQERRQLDFSEDGVNVMKARYLKGLGQRYGLDPFQHVDVGEIDAVADARPILERARKSSGTGRGGGAEYDDTASEREQRQRQQEAEKHQSEECDNAADWCEDGDEGACEFLVETCGYDQEEAEKLVEGGLLSDTSSDTEATTAQTELVSVGGSDGRQEIEVTGAEASALRRSWQGYKGAISSLSEALQTAREDITNARRAIQAINAIRRNNGQGEIEPERLGELLVEASDIPGSLPKPTRIDQFAEADDQQSEGSQAANDAGPSGTQFASEKQGTLGVDVEAETVAEEKQVTLTGEDEGASSAALPSRWSREGDRWTAGPYTVQLDSPDGGSTWIVKLLGDGSNFDVATNVRDVAKAEQIAVEFTDRVAPEEVTFKASDATVMEAAATAKKAAFEADS